MVVRPMLRLPGRSSRQRIDRTYNLAERTDAVRTCSCDSYFDLQFSRRYALSTSVGCRDWDTTLSWVDVRYFIRSVPVISDHR